MVPDEYNDAILSSQLDSSKNPSLHNEPNLKKKQKGKETALLACRLCTMAKKPDIPFTIPPPLPLTLNPRFNTCVEPPAGIRRSDESQSSGVANNFLAAPRPTARVGIPVAVAAAAIAPRPSLSPT
jgi:hypothetical protein